MDYLLYCWSHWPGIVASGLLVFPDFWMSATGLPVVPYPGMGTMEPQSFLRLEWMPLGCLCFLGHWPLEIIYTLQYTVFIMVLQTTKNKLDRLLLSLKILDILSKRCYNRVISVLRLVHLDIQRLGDLFPCVLFHSLVFALLQRQGYSPIVSISFLLLSGEESWSSYHSLQLHRLPFWIRLNSGMQ